RGIEDLCLALSRIAGVETLAVSTNGVLLHEKAPVLRGAGITGVNISLDSLRPDRFHHITSHTSHDEVLRGIQAAQQAGFPSVKINTVVMRGFNDDELLDFVAFAIDRALNVRFIEYMPFLGNHWGEVRLMPYCEMKTVVEQRYCLVPVQRSADVAGPAREFQIDGTHAVIGFISTMTDHACSSCNRLRLTADGKLRNCLFAWEDVDLKALLRAGVRRETIEAAIRLAVSQKWDKHPEVNELIDRQNRTMVAIGG
ncbi:MAG: molybdenum cofactor biosynthesis protein, partial [Bacteroidetes bacterium]|nr:molybdenum cofactor biosynthesis protein [Bacteroidota bacterium]